MAGDVSFDVVSDFDRQELVNALDQARREGIQPRNVLITPDGADRVRQVAAKLSQFTSGSAAIR